INTLTQTQVTTFPVAGGAVRVLLGPDETKLYVTLDNGGLTVLNSTSGTVDTTIQLGSVALNGVALTSDRSRLYVSSVGGTVIETIPVLGSPRHLAMTPDGTTAVVANEAGVVQIIR